MKPFVRVGSWAAAVLVLMLLAGGVGGCGSQQSGVERIRPER